MTFDELYDEMLSMEFSTRGRHAKPEMIVDPATAVAAVVADDVCGSARHAKADAVEATAQDSRERPTGLARYRTAGLVGAGGLACATLGAFLGGLGGYFTVSPAGAHAVASTSQDSPAATASHVARSAGSAAMAATTEPSFSLPSGGLTSAGSGLGSVTAAPSSNAPVVGGPVGGGTGGGAPIPGNGSGGSTGGGSTTTGGGSTGTTLPTGGGGNTSTCTGVGCVVGVNGLPSLPVPTPSLPVTVPTPSLPVAVPPLPVSVPPAPALPPVTVTAPAPLPTTPPPVTVGPVSVSTTSTGGGTTLNVGL